jgi:hypothetical protein
VRAFLSEPILTPPDSRRLPNSRHSVAQLTIPSATRTPGQGYSVREYAGEVTAPGPPAVEREAEEDWGSKG